MGDAPRHLKLYASQGYAYRVPTFTDLYYQSPANRGNPDLRPEQSVSYEVGVKWLTRGILGQASVFHRNGSDLIDWTRGSPVPVS